MRSSYGVRRCGGAGNEEREERGKRGKRRGREMLVWRPEACFKDGDECVGVWNLHIRKSCETKDRKNTLRMETVPLHLLQIQLAILSRRQL